MYTANDVGLRLVDGEEIVLPLIEREALAEEWNARAIEPQIQRDAGQAERLRIEGLNQDVLAEEMLSRLRVATAQQIADYVDTNVTDLHSARTMFKRVLIVMALMVRGV